jgi:hypothetical protein
VPRLAVVDHRSSPRTRTPLSASKR